MRRMNKTLAYWLRLPHKPVRSREKAQRMTLKGGPYDGQVWLCGGDDRTTLTFQVTRAGQHWHGRYIKGRWRNE